MHVQLNLNLTQPIHKRPYGAFISFNHFVNFRSGFVTHLNSSTKQNVQSHMPKISMEVEFHITNDVSLLLVIVIAFTQHCGAGNT